MNAILLQMFSPETDELMLEMSRANGRVSLDFARSKGLRKMVESWIEHGLREFVRDADGDLVDRFTSPTAPDFLENVAAYLEQQSRARVELSDAAIQEWMLPPQAAETPHGDV